jgi:succinate dehydrogenase/fumarate reductase-like Fe-S protein
MNQTALVVYLKNLRDLETAKAKLKEILRKEQTAFEQEDEALKRTRYLRYYKVDFYRYFNMNFCVICAVCFSAALLLLRNVNFASAGRNYGGCRLVYPYNRKVPQRSPGHAHSERASKTS